MKKNKQSTIVAYRNASPVNTHQGVLIDQGALWHRKFNKPYLVLVDEDEYLTADFNTNTFQPVK